MLSVDDALQSILGYAMPLAPREVALADALGLMLAEAVASDVDSPPHDKSIVDGYAVVAASLDRAGVVLEVLEEVTAGQVPRCRLSDGHATRIMTGAPVPEGADAVVMVERTQADDSAPGQRVRIDEFPVKTGQNIMRRAAAMRRGQIVLPAGKVLRGIEIGLLAEVGRSRVPAYPRSAVAVISTGNELVSASEIPGPGQIRNSNGPMLAALVRQAGGEPMELGIASDTEASLHEKIERGLHSDVLLLSGGVSAGVLDLVPQVLANLGVEQIFHKVNLKPGKPLWFGRREAAGRSTLVFGLPGNPVSSLVSFELFVRPALARLAGHKTDGLLRVAARLMKEHRQRGERPTYWPARLSDDAVTPLSWKGSGDLATLARADCLAHFPPGDRTFAPGEAIDVLRLPGHSV